MVDPENTQFWSSTSEYEVAIRALSTLTLQAWWQTVKNAGKGWADRRMLPCLAHASHSFLSLQAAVGFGSQSLMFNWQNENLIYNYWIAQSAIAYEQKC